MSNNLTSLISVFTVKRRSDLARLLLLSGLTIFLAACSVPTSLEGFNDGWACEQVALVKTAGLALGAFFGFAALVIFAIGKFASGVLPANVVSFCQQNLNNVIMGILVLMIAIPVFWAFMGQLGGPTCG